jgi:hypothetical protein
VKNETESIRKEDAIAQFEALFPMSTPNNTTGCTEHQFSNGNEKTLQHNPGNSIINNTAMRKSKPT